MKLEILPYGITVCQLAELSQVELNSEFYFLARTDEEISLVCKTSEVPELTVKRDDGWRGFRIEGVLDFSLVGILAGISSVLSQNSIGIFAVSTYNTDYVLVKEKDLEKAIKVLSEAGYTLK